MLKQNRHCLKYNNAIKRILCLQLPPSKHIRNSFALLLRILILIYIMILED